MTDENKPHLDTETNKSSLQGFGGLMETTIKTFRQVSFGLILAPIMLLYIVCMGVSIAPGIMLFEKVNVLTSDYSTLIRAICLGMSIASAYMMYGFTLIFVVPLCNKLLPLKVKPQRTTWFSLGIIPWYYHNALTYLVRYTFLDIITPTPFNKLFYQMMGMKIGKGTMINTSNISDPCLIEIGDNVTIGGSCTLVAHYGMKGIMIIDRLIIKDRATIGLHAKVFGDVVVGEGATVKPGEIVYPKTRIPDVVRESR